MQTRWLAALLFAPAVGIALVAAQAPAPAGGLQDPQVTFRLDVDYVEVDAVVTDAAGSIVRGLTADDFEILEDGDPQEVEAFTFVDLPVEPARPPLFAEAPIEPDVWSNAVPFEGRLYILVLDDYNTMALRTGRVRAAARRFVEEHIGENDLAAVLHTSGRPNASQDFTNSRPLLLSAIEQFAGRKTQISSLERFDITDRDTVEELQLLDDRWLDPTDYQKASEAEASLHTITEVARFLSSINGRRKALVLISEGIDYNIFDPFNLPRASTIMDETRQAIAEATPVEHLHLRRRSARSRVGYCRRGRIRASGRLGAGLRQPVQPADAVAIQPANPRRRDERLRCHQLERFRPYVRADRGRELYVLPSGLLPDEHRT